mgnify:CR=1 FL=1
MNEWPKHTGGGMHITHNDHLSNYMTAQEALETGYYSYVNFSDEARDECMRTGSVWVLQWYPDTPCGFYAVGGPTLEWVRVKALGG